MKTALIATTGNSDMQVYSENKSLFEKHGILLIPNREIKDFFLISDCRNGGKIIVEHFNDFKDVLHFPIIQKAIDYIKNLNNILLVVTDQSKAPNAKDFHKNRDTIYIGHFLMKYINQKYSGKIKVDILTVEHNVAYYDSMYKFFGDNSTLKNFLDRISSDDKLYLLPQGGIDAINTSLMLRTIEIAGKQMTQLFVGEDGNITPLNFPNLFLKNIEKHILHHLIKNYQYEALLKMQFPEKLQLLTKYALYRLNLQYDEAQQKLEQLKKEDSDNRNQLLLFNINNKNESGLKLKDLYLSFKIKLNNEQYADALFRLFALQDLFFQLSAEKIFECKISINMKEDKWKKSLEEKKLIEPLEQCIIDGRKLDYSRTSRRVLKEIYRIKSDDNFKNEWLSLFNSIEKLDDLRNRFAHDGKGITRDDVEKEIANTELRTIDDLKSKIEELLKINDFDIYNKINELLEKYLQSE